MNYGAIIIASAEPEMGGVIAPMQPAGAVSVGQRMISAFQRAGIPLIAVVTGYDARKLERSLSQNGVVFLRNERYRSSRAYQSVRIGLTYMAEKAGRVLLTPGDIPFFLPETPETLLSSSADIAVPIYRRTRGYPVMLTARAIRRILADEDAVSLENALDRCPLSRQELSVEDPGILIHGNAVQNRQDLIDRHDAALTRPVAQVTLNRCIPFFDARVSTLLHLVDETRSVRLASSLMQISYSTAWHMLNNGEHVLGHPLIARSRGGAGGSGSTLTEFGRKLLNAYDNFSREIDQSVQTLYSAYFQTLQI